MEACRTPSAIGPLTVRQVQMMDMICQGKVYKEIATELGMKNRTRVGCSMVWVRKKLRARTMGQAIAIYCELKRPAKSKAQ